MSKSFRVKKLMSKKKLRVKCKNRRFVSFSLNTVALFVLDLLYDIFIEYHRQTQEGGGQEVRVLHNYYRLIAESEKIIDC